MKDKRKQIFLFVAVMLIWGAIGYQFYNMVRTEKTVVKDQSVITPLADTLHMQSYQLMVNYRDPFLKKVNRQPKKASARVSVVSPQVNATAASTINWGAFRFIGTVENDHTKDRVAIVNFQGEMMMLKRNDVIKGFRVIKVAKDSLYIGFDNQVKTIPKHTIR